MLNGSKYEEEACGRAEGGEGQSLQREQQVKQRNAELGQWRAMGPSPTDAGPSSPVQHTRLCRQGCQKSFHFLVGLNQTTKDLP